MLKISLLITLIFVILTFGFWKLTNRDTLPEVISPDVVSVLPQSSQTPIVSVPDNTELPISKTLSNDYHIFQSFNNCGPAALSMALSYYDINKSQQELGSDLRPYQNPKGDNDDKSVTLEEVAKKADTFGLKSYLRPNGDITKVKQFIASGIPVIARTYLKKGEDIGHYRIIKGYDDAASQLVQDDSLQGKNLKYSYSDFDALWSDFNHEYLVLVPEDKTEVVEKIIGDDTDENLAWTKTVTRLESQLQSNPNNTTFLFNLAVAKYKIKDYQGSVEAFEKVENRLSFRTLWYQIEPILSYYELGNYDRVMQISDKILNNQNRAFSELYILRAEVYLKTGQKQQAAEQLAQAKIYNRNIYINPALLEQVK